jgi:V8-like Glu-specific endopeptidase
MQAKATLMMKKPRNRVLLSALAILVLYGTGSKAQGLLDMNWNAVGKLTFADGRFCTGTLVAEKVVLTAAHCFFDERYNRNDKATFQAAFHFGGVQAASPAIKAIIPDDFDPAQLGYGVVDGFDYAFLVLKWPVGQEVGFLDLGRPDAIDVQVGNNAVTVGYGDAGNRLAAGINCKIISTPDNHTFQHDCATADGDSGGPIFLVKNAILHFIGITSYGFPNVGDYIQSAVSKAAFLDELVRVTGNPSSLTDADASKHHGG